VGEAMIDQRLVRLELNDDGGVDVLYDDWYVVKITKQGGLMRHRRVGGIVLKTSGPLDKIKLVAEPQ
jgi:hypothetical protein